LNIVEVRAQLEEELTWRLDEIRFLHNQLSYMRKEEEKKRYRKALVVMLYSHFEGFCKTAISIYATTINQENLACSLVTDQIIAASLATVFQDFENTDKKSNIFRRDLPEDTNIHRFARQVELISVLDEIWMLPVNIPVDDVVVTEANLKPPIILYRLGLPHDAFKENEGKIHLLLNYRNSISHGAAKDGISEKRCHPELCVKITSKQVGKETRAEQRT
jgi:RiboL-PSP-HEPN